jgi:hypothetical protein
VVYLLIDSNDQQCLFLTTLERRSTLGHPNFFLQVSAPHSN